MGNVGAHSLKSGKNIVDLGDILPGEKILGEYSPSRESYKKSITSRVFSNLISLLSPVVIALVEFIGFGSNSNLTVEEILITVGVTTIMTLVILGFSLAKFKTEFSARYVITSTRVAKIIKNRIKMDIPVEQIEDAVITFGAVLRLKDYAVFFPPRGYMDLKGVNLNFPMVTSRVVELERTEEGNNSKIMKNKDGKVTIGNAKIARTHLKNIRRTRRDIIQRSFLFLTEEMARDAAKKYWDFVKNNI